MLIISNAPKIDGHGEIIYNNFSLGEHFNYLSAMNNFINTVSDHENKLQVSCLNQSKKNLRN